MFTALGLSLSPPLSHADGDVDALRSHFSPLPHKPARRGVHPPTSIEPFGRICLSSASSGSLSPPKVMEVIKGLGKIIVLRPILDYWIHLQSLIYSVQLVAEYF